MFETLPGIPIDYSPQLQISSSVDVAQFGDGYAQRRPSGINHQNRSQSVTWSLLTQDEYNTLIAFLEPRLNLEPFVWAAPWDDVDRQWICSGLSGSVPTSARFGSLQATFNRDYTPG